jgi:glycosyltransferase involved in cell wall biosynthesis
MKIFVPNISNTKIGGGWTFLKNFQKASVLAGFTVTDNPTDYDILFAFAPTTIDGGTIQKAKDSGKPFVLRLDGVPEDSRNSGSGTRKLVEYSSLADHLVYQTQFVKNTLGRILVDMGIDKPSNIIYNGVDTDVFTPEGPKMPLKGDLKILHVNYRKDNNKRYEEVVAMYRELWTYRKDVNLVLMGRYPTEWQDYGMGFFNGEHVSRYGVITDDEQKAMIMRSCDVFFYPSFADPSPNVVLEAMACGVPVVYNPYGGTKELVHYGGIALDHDELSFDRIIRCFNPNEKFKDYAREVAEQEFSLPIMGENYKLLFERVLA